MTTSRLRPFGPAGHFYEGLRWHEGRWWLSDSAAGRVLSLDASGEPRTELQVEGDHVLGLGWLPDGAMLVTSMQRRQVLRRPPGGGAAEVFADLSALTAGVGGFINDMWVTAEGHAYVGFDVEHTDPEPEKGMLLHVDPSGRAEIAARGLCFPNGVVVTPDRRTLVVAETFRPRFTSFAIGAGGRLGPAELWADLADKRDRRADPTPPFDAGRTSLDGCTMDADGCIWVANVREACIRVAPGGDIVDAIYMPAGLHAFSCALGGEGGRELLICAANTDISSRMAQKGSHLFIADVATPAA
jgi:sugar lactone lactonase YvrE